MSTRAERGSGWRRQLAGAIGGAICVVSPVHASFFAGEALDRAADVISWIVLLVVPIIVIALFWMVHVLPEKIAERRGHPQAQAIKMLCLLSLAFGGLLWPLAWLWAYTKPVLYKMAYGTDRIEHHEEPEKLPPPGAPELVIRPEAMKPEAIQPETMETLRRVR